MLHILPGHISNLIAAGEVVQRPASVVKEMVENAVDAGATSVQVIIKDAGRTLIQIIDDGCGMTAEEARMAFLRHATSKINEIEDLNRLNTYGFRGEALASIAAVAEVTLKTRQDSNETGYEVKFAESKLISENEVSAPAGSNFIVRNIFTMSLQGENSLSRMPPNSDRLHKSSQGLRLQDRSLHSALFTTTLKSTILPRPT